MINTPASTVTFIDTLPWHFLLEADVGDVEEDNFGLNRNTLQSRTNKVGFTTVQNIRSHSAFSDHRIYTARQSQRSVERSALYVSFARYRRYRESHPCRPQDASLIRLPSAYAPHVQAGFQGCVLMWKLTKLLTVRCYTEHGPVKMSTFLVNYHVGDIVDIKANAAQQKGMPHKYYHGYVFVSSVFV